MKIVLHLCLLLLAQYGLGLPCMGQRESSAPFESVEGARARLRARWLDRPSDERERLERHLQEFEKLPARTKLRLLERARALRERERSVTEEMPEDLRRQMQFLGPERGDDLWRQHLRERFRAFGHEMRSRLPEELLRRLEQAPPNVRHRAFERLREERERIGLTPREAQRLRPMPLPERIRALRELGRRADGAARGRPRPPH